MPFDPAKYLQTFGWDKGKGLGKNEDGAVNFVKVVKKDDTAGVGAREDWGVQSRFSDDFAKNLKSIKIVIEGDDVQVVKRKDRKKEAEREKPALVHGAFQRSEYVLNEENIFSREALAPVIKTNDDDVQSTSAAPASAARNGVGVYSSRVSGKLARVQAANAAYQAALPAASPANNSDSAGAATVPTKAPKSNAPVLAFSSFTKSGSGAATSSSKSSALSIAEQAFQAAMSMRVSHAESDDEDNGALKSAKSSASQHGAPFQFTYSNDSDDGGDADEEKSKRKRQRKEERRVARAAEPAAIVEEQVENEGEDAAKARRKQEKRERKRAAAAVAEDAAAEEAPAAPVEQESCEDRAARKAAKKLLKRKSAE